jgi:hypothetical protein
MVKKIAICVGQNSYAPASGVTPLNGCVNDALLIGEMLRMAGFHKVRQVHNEAATQTGILGRLEDAVASLREGDYLVFWNSSHGYQVTDRSGDELYDYKDEAICTWDTDPRAPLTDDKFAQILTRAHPGAFVFFGSDSCHSGTLTRASASGSADHRQPRRWIPPEDIRFRSGEPIINLGDYVRGMSQPEPASAPVRPFGLLGREPEALRHVLLSGCRAEQVSWDAKLGGRFHGAMTYHFAIAVLRAWQQGSAITYGEAHRQACEGIIEARFDQTPQLEGTLELTSTPVFGHTPKPVV